MAKKNIMAQLINLHEEVRGIETLQKMQTVRAIYCARHAGRILAGAKHRVTAGNWEVWLKTRCKGMSVKTAEEYIEFYRTPHVSYFGLAQSLRQA